MGLYKKEKPEGKTVSTTKNFERWLRKIKRAGLGDNVLSILHQFQEHGHVKNIHEVKSIKNAQDLLEYRLLIQRQAYRLYYSDWKRLLILLLLGGGKDSQTRDIEMAKKLLKVAKENLESKVKEYKEFVVLEYLEKEPDLCGYLLESSKSEYPEFKLVALETASTAIGIQRVAKILRLPFRKLYAALQKESEITDEEATQILEKLARGIKRNLAKEKAEKETKYRLTSINSELLRMAKEANAEAHPYPSPTPSKPISGKEEEELSKAKRDKKKPE